MGRYTGNGRGTKVSPGEIRRYEKLREARFSPKEAAITIGRSPAWAYTYEQKKRIESMPPAGREWRRRDNPPAANLFDAVTFLLAFSKDDADPALNVLERFGVELIFSVAEVALYLARVRAGDMQRDIESLLENEDWLPEVKANPITHEDILEHIPPTLDCFRAGENIAERWMPPRAQAWFDRFAKSYPDLEEIYGLAKEALRSDDPDKGIAQLRDRVDDGEFL